MSFRFIHTADLHLDAPLKAMALRDPDLAQQLGVATRIAFSRIIDLCIAQDVAFLVIAGDLWDGAYSSSKTPRFVKQELLRLRAAGIKCFIIRGNHDALARQTGELDLPDNTKLFGHKADTVLFDHNGHPIAVHGLSFREIHANDSLLPQYPRAQNGAFNLGIMHTSLNGSPGHDNYAPCSLNDLNAMGYDYWALGHIHRRSEYLSSSTVVMPGTPQSRDIGEAGDTSVTLVTVADDNSITLSPYCVAPLRFDRLDLDCSPYDTWGGLLSAIENLLHQTQQIERHEDHLVVRLVLRGTSPLAWRINRDLDRLSEETRAFASHANLWLDKIELQLTTAVTANDGTLDLPPDFISALFDILPQDPGLKQDIYQATQTILRALPADLNGIWGEDEAEIEQSCQELLRQGLPLILAKLTDEEAK